MSLKHYQQIRPGSVLVWTQVLKQKITDLIETESVYGSFFEYSDLKQNQINKITKGKNK